MADLSTLSKEQLLERKALLERKVELENELSRESPTEKRQEPSVGIAVAKRTDPEGQRISQEGEKRKQEIISESGLSERRLKQGGTDEFVRGTTALEQLQDVFVLPLMEVQRAQQKGAAEFFEVLDKGTELLERRFGIPRSGTFGDLQKIGENLADDVPEVKDSTALEFINRGAGSVIGSAPSIGVKFAMAGKIPGLSGGGLSEIGKFAVVESVEGFRREGEAGIVPGALSGVTFGFAFPVVARIAKETAMLGVNIPKFLLRMITGNRGLVERYSRNPNAFNTNAITGKTKSLEDKVKENEIAKAQIKRSQRRETESFTETKIKQREDLTLKLNEAKSKLSKVQNDASNALRQTRRERTEEGKSRIAQLEIDQNNALADYKNTAGANLLRIYDTFLSKLSQIVKQEGESVAVAVGNVINKDLTARVPKSSVMKRVSDIADEAGYVIKLKKVGKGKEKVEKLVAEPKFKSGEDTGVTKRLNLTLDDLQAGFMDNGGTSIALGRLQAIKTGLQNISRGTNNLLTTRADKFMGRLAGKLNPVSFKDSILAKNAGKELKELGEVNRSFSELKKRHSEAIANFTRKDASGNSVPDFRKAVNAVRGNDTATIRQMRKADAALPPESRILPQVEKHVAELRRVQTQTLANIRLMKKQTKAELDKLVASQKKTSALANSEQTRLRSDLARRQREGTRKLREKQEDELRKKLDSFDEQEQFLKDELALRQFAGSGMSRTFQGVAAFSLLGASAQARAGIPGAGVTAGTGLALAAALSPNVQANILKTNLNLANKVKGYVKNLDLVLAEGKTKVASRILQSNVSDVSRPINERIKNFNER